MLQDAIEKDSSYPDTFETPSLPLKMPKKKKKKKFTAQKICARDLYDSDFLNVSNEAMYSDVDTNVADITSSVQTGNSSYSSGTTVAEVHSYLGEGEESDVASVEDNLSSVENFIREKECKKSKLNKRSKATVTTDGDSPSVSRESGSSDVEANVLASSSKLIYKSNTRKRSRKKRGSSQSNSVEGDPHCVVSDVTNGSSVIKNKKKKSKSQKIKVSDINSLDPLNVSTESESRIFDTNAVLNNIESVEKNNQNSCDHNRSGVILDSEELNRDHSDNNVCYDKLQLPDSMTLKDEVTESMADCSQSDSSCNLRLVFTDSDNEIGRSPLCDTPSAPSVRSENLPTKERVISVGDRSFQSLEDFNEFLDDFSLNSSSIEESLKKEMEGLSIIVMNPHPLHCMTTPIYKAPGKEVREEICRQFAVKEGSFTKQEDDVIMANWKELSEKQDLESPEPFLNPRRYKLHPQLVRDFVQYLGQGLPDRPLYKIFNRFKYLCEHQKKGPFSSEEDDLILSAMRKPMKNPFSVLCKILKRNRQCIYKRYKMLLETKKDEPSETKKSRAVWSIELATSIVQSLRKIYEVTNIEELRDRKIPTRIWRKVEDDTKVSYWKLRQFWCYQLHVQLFALSPISENHILKRIVKWLYRTKPKTTKDIPWKNSVHLFPGSTEWFMWERFRRLRKRIHAEKFSSFKDFLRFLKKHPESIELSQEKLTPRYKVSSDYTLTAIDE